ncbi:WW domain-containing transcription regulator protein 1 isoform X2 [Apteryx mantelli]|uniref:WW domain-containing transcription regulator protein 1 isoform X2 n=1 Tax=Apteryx mantelli TaxID=2696672 RepID=A0ABM4EY50_9AVES
MNPAPAPPPPGQQVIHVTQDLDTELEALFNAVMNPKPSSWRKKILPESFFREPDSGAHSRQSSTDSGGPPPRPAAAQHVRSHSSPASLVGAGAGAGGGAAPQHAHLRQRSYDVTDELPLPPGWEMALTHTGQRYFLKIEMNGGKGYGVTVRDGATDGRWELLPSATRVLRSLSLPSMAGSRLEGSPAKAHQQHRKKEEMSISQISQLRPTWPAAPRSAPEQGEGPWLERGLPLQREHEFRLSSAAVTNSRLRLTSSNAGLRRASEKQSYRACRAKRCPCSCATRLRLTWPPTQHALLHCSNGPGSGSRLHVGDPALVTVFAPILVTKGLNFRMVLCILVFGIHP